MVRGLGLSHAMELTLIQHIPKITPNNPVPWAGETEILFQSFQAEHFRPKSCWFFCRAWQYVDSVSVFLCVWNKFWGSDWSKVRDVMRRR